MGIPGKNHKRGHPLVSLPKQVTQFALGGCDAVGFHVCRVHRERQVQHDDKRIFSFLDRLRNFFPGWACQSHNGNSPAEGQKKQWTAHKCDRGLVEEVR